MIRISILSPALETINYTSKKDGSPQQLRKQTAYAHTVDSEGVASPYPEKFGFILGRDQQHAFAPGDYTLHPSAFTIRDGKLLLSDTRLTPVKPAAPKTNA